MDKRNAEQKKRQEAAEAKRLELEAEKKAKEEAAE